MTGMQLTDDASKYYGDLSDIIGRPHGYLDSADPGRRTYVRHLLSGAPLVAIRPGRIKFVSTDGLAGQIATRLGSGISPEEVNSFLTPGGSGVNNVFNMSMGYGVSGAEEAAIKTAIEEKAGAAPVSSPASLGAGSVRYFDFDPHYDEYMSVVSTMTGRLYSRMTQSTASWTKGIAMATAVGTTNGGFFTHWAENATSVSESFSAEVGPTILAGAVKQLSELSRQGQFFLGKDFATGEQKDGMIKSAMDSISGALHSNSVGGVSASLGDAVLGLNPMFPDVWKDSSFARSYNVAFKFFSPYGDPMAIFQNVYLPFAMLLSLVMPVLRSPGAYSEPFVFQMYAPGYFACDMGICTEFSFTKGGGEGMFTTQGLPRQIDVTMQVRDLYPVLAASHNNKSMLLNTDLGTFLDNLAGVSLQRSGQNIDAITNLKAQLASGVISLAQLPDRAKAAVSRVFTETTGIAPFLQSLGSLF